MPVFGAHESVGIDLTTGTRLELPSATDEGANTKPDETLSIITLDQLPKEYHAYLLPVTTH